MLASLEVRGCGGCGVELKMDSVFLIFLIFLEIERCRHGDGVLEGWFCNVMRMWGYAREAAFSQR